MLSKTTVVVFMLFFVSALKSSAQVNLQTGSAVFSLPLFDWKDDKSRLVSTLALSYNSGNGLRVNDVASNVGQGWNLVAGGVITRMQVGAPDDQQLYETGTNENNGDITKFPYGYLTGTPSPLKGCPQALTRYPTYGGKNNVYAQHNLIAQDRELDYFSFQFNGKSGQFVIDPNGGWHAVPLGDTKMLISVQQDPTMLTQGIRTTITSFTITDVDGLVYKFTGHGTTKVLQTIFSTADGTQTTTQPTIKNNGSYCQAPFDVGPTGTPWVNSKLAYPYIISNWYLTEVDDPLTGRKIQYSYNPLSLSNQAGTDITFNSGSDSYIVVSYKKSITTEQELNTISYPDGHSVQFNYASTSRFDYVGQKALANVTVSYNSRNLSQYQLNTTYFILNRYGTPATPYEKSVARLCLRSVKKIGVDLKEDSPPYTFDYYTGSNAADDFVPPPFFPAKDIWGYYNGNNSIASNSPLSGPGVVAAILAAPNLHTLPFTTLKGLCFLNDNVTGTYYNAKPGYAQNGLLKEIIYPTGGNLTYTYAQNTGSFISPHTSDMTVGGVHVAATSSADGGYSNGCANPVVTNYAYVVSTGGASSLWGLETPVNQVSNVNSWQEEHQTIHFSFSQPFGECLWHYIYPGIQSQYAAISIGEFQKIMAAMAPILGVLSVVSTIEDVINVIGDASCLYIVTIVLDVITAVLSYIISCPQQKKTTSSTVYYNFDLNQIAPLPAQFKRVEIVEGSGTIGKTIQEFTQGDPNDPGGVDYPLWFAANTNTAFSAKQRFAPWVYGLPKFTTVLDASGNMIRQTQNSYDFTNAKTLIQDAVAAPQGQTAVQTQSASPQSAPPTYVPLASCKCQVNNSYSQRYDGWSDQSQYNNVYLLPGANADVNVDIYDYYTGRALLSRTLEKTYRTTDQTQVVQTQTNYYYNYNTRPLCSGCINTPGNYDLNQVMTIQSNGDTVHKRIYYNSDYNTGILATLVQKNIMSLPVMTVTTVNKAGAPAQAYLGEKVTEYTAVANGDIRPSRVIEQRFAVPAATMIGYSGPTTTNYAYYKIPQHFYYDANSNLTGVYDEGGRAVTNLYDYNDKYIVASVINADPTVDKVAYTSFESGDLSRSGWTLAGSQPAAPVGLSETGSTCFSLLASGANSLTASSLNTAKPYTLSFWADRSGVSISGGTATLVKSAPTCNGFTYYEYTVSAGASGVVVQNGGSTTVNIDELRLYPATGRMRTTTYDPLIGKTSECDENNRITYYTYDNLGRMQTIQNETHQIVKAYEYNNVSPSKLAGCPTTYSNHALSELVTRSNCAAGYQGTAVAYTVAAGAYTSAISQQDADFRAEIYFLTNAQTYANANGGCALIYYNVQETETTTVQSCAAGYVGGSFTYTVPAQRYSSIISQADADQQAIDDTTANAQAAANDLTNGGTCTLDTSPDWEWFAGDGTTPADPSYCLSVGGQLPPHLFVLAKDVNPNSPSYNQTQYYDYGPNNACPANTYYNAAYSQSFTKACSAGNIGSSVAYTVPPGKYNSTVSQAAADQQAANEAAANGQNNANANGTCVPGITISGQNESGLTFHAQFNNTTTGAVTIFTITPATTANLGSLLPGNYSVFIYPSPTSSTKHTFYMCGTTYSNVSNATFSGIVIGSSCNSFSIDGPPGF